MEEAVPQKPVDPKNPPEKKKLSKPAVIIIILLVLVNLQLGVYIFLKNKTTNQKMVPPTAPTATPATSPAPTVITTPTEAAIPADWQTYKNTAYGFEISYPKTYQALTDKDNLYGWPNAVVLLYNGGQSYDIPIEIWDSKQAYEAKYSSQIGSLIVKQIGSKYLTILNATVEPGNAAVIATFKLSSQ